MLWLALAHGANAGEGEGESRRTTPAPGEQATVTTVVSGVIGYTRWPSTSTSPPTALRICAVGGGRGVDELAARNDATDKQAVRARVVGELGDAVNQCDVIYVGRLAGDAPRELLRRIVGRPVLTIGEGAEFCSDGGMFCLLADPGAVRFAVNLDAVARSGLRVNPWVLRIARTPSRVAQK